MGKKKMESREGTVPLPQAPLLLRNLIFSILNLINLEKSFLSFLQNYNLLETFRYVFVTSYLFFLRFVPSFFLQSFVVSENKYDAVKDKPYKYLYDTRAPQNGSSIGRMLSILNNIPVSSRKYELVRSLAERIIDDNHNDGVHSLREVNRLVLSAAFSRALRQLEAAAAEGEGEGDYYYRMRRVLRTVGGWRVRGEGGLCGVEAEKLAACGCAEEASRRWAAASNLGCLALTADPRFQTCFSNFQHSCSMKPKTWAKMKSRKAR